MGIGAAREVSEIPRGFERAVCHDRFAVLSRLGRLASRACKKVTRNRPVCRCPKVPDPESKTGQEESAARRNGKALWQGHAEPCGIGANLMSNRCAPMPRSYSH